MYTLESGVHTGDFGDKAITSLNTTQFADAIIGNFGKLPSVNPKPSLPNKYKTPTHFVLANNPMLESTEVLKEEIIGVDFFVESHVQPKMIAELALKHTLTLFNLTTVTNRGTQVWPTGSIFTNLVNTYMCRFESADGEPLTQVDILELYKRMMVDFKVCSMELLNQLGGKKMYSSAQGQ